MMTIAEQARAIADLLSRSLGKLEIRSTAVEEDAAVRAIHDVWLTVIDDYASGRADVSSGYLATVHTRLTVAAGLCGADGFSDRGLPMLPNGNRESWSRFVQEGRFTEECGFEEEYVLAQLRWGNHVQTFALTIGWFAMNIVRLLRGEIAVYAPSSDHDHFLEYLKFAGPDAYDAEAGLRGLAEKYAKEQSKGSGELAPNG